MDEKTIWKQMLPIPQGYIIYIPIEDENGTVWENVEVTSGWAYVCLVLYDAHYKDYEGNNVIESRIGLYCIDNCGTGVLEGDYKLVKVNPMKVPPNTLPYPMGNKMSSHEPQQGMTNEPKRE